jgi:P pilus assembly chaperone PapD
LAQCEKYCSNEKDEVNKLQVNIKSKFKIFYRPNGLAGEPDDAWRKLTFNIEGSRLVAQNPTPYFVSFLLFRLAVQIFRTRHDWPL